MAWYRDQSHDDNMSDDLLITWMSFLCQDIHTYGDRLRRALSGFGIVVFWILPICEQFVAIESGKLNAGIW